MDKKTFARLLKDAEPAVQREFIEAIQRAATGIRLKDVEAAIAANDDAALISLFALDRGDFARYERALFDAFAAAGDAAMTSHMALAAGQGANIGRVVFDASNPVATTWLRERSSLLIREIEDQQREVIRDTLTATTREGRSTSRVALDMVGRVNRSTGRREGGVLGLTRAQAGYAQSAYDELTSGDPAVMRGYLDRKLRDRRFDGLVRKAIEDGKPIAGTKADEMVRNYRNRLLNKRGETVARTETIAAMNEAEQDSLRQLTERGIVDDQDMEHEWDASEDADTRDSHAAMDGQRQPHGQPFVSGLGNLMMYPGDRSLGAPAEDVIACRCARRTRIDFIGAENRRNR